MSVYRTQADLVQKIIEKLGVVPEGVTPNPEDTARITNNLPSLVDELAGREIVYVPDLNNIPGAWFLSIAAVCAYEMRDEFGITGEALADLARANGEAIGKLQVMTRGRPTYEPQRTVSF